MHETGDRPQRVHELQTARVLRVPPKRTSWLEPRLMPRLQGRAWPPQRRPLPCEANTAKRDIQVSL